MALYAYIKFCPTLPFRLNVKFGVFWQRGFREEYLCSMVNEGRRQKATTADDQNGWEGHSIWLSVLLSFCPPKVVGTLRAKLLQQFYGDSFEIVQVPWSFRVVWILSSGHFCNFFGTLNFVNFFRNHYHQSEYIVCTSCAQLFIQYYTDSFKTFLLWFSVACFWCQSLGDVSPYMCSYSFLYDSVDGHLFMN